MAYLFSTINITYQFKPSPELSYQVPQLIQFLWIGSRIPEKYVDNIETWAEKNQEYQVLDTS